MAAKQRERRFRATKDSRARPAQRGCMHGRGWEVARGGWSPSTRDSSAAACTLYSPMSSSTTADAAHRAASSDTADIFRLRRWMSSGERR